MGVLIADGTGGSVDLPQRGATRDELIAWAQGMKLAPNSAVGQLEGLATTGVVTLTDAAAKTLSTSAAAGAGALESSETLTVGGAIDVAKRTTYLNGTGAQALTLGNGTYDGQEKFLWFRGTGSGVWTATGLANLKGFTQIQLTKDAQVIGLRWSASDGMWAPIGGNALLS